jgi:ketosteroid isomerase-like protein
LPRLLFAALGVAVLGSACKVERTPPEYFDHRKRPAAIAAAAAAELEDRIVAFGQAVSRGSVTEAVIAAGPAVDATVLTPRAGEVLTGPDGIRGALEEITRTYGRVRVISLSVAVSPEGDAAWFTTEIGEAEPESDAPSVLVTGVYLLAEGGWRLVQAHVSIPSPNPAAPASDAIDPGV